MSSRESESDNTQATDAPNEVLQVGSPTDSMMMLREIAETQSNLAGMNAMMRQQVGQLHEAVRHLYDAVGAQVTQIQSSSSSLRHELREELQKFQMAGPQKAMAGVFHKLFGDLLLHMNHLDELVASLPADEAASGWGRSLAVMRDSYEGTLTDWGCSIVVVIPGESTFDPELHESVAPEPGDVPVPAVEGTICRVRRRGWRLHDRLLQYPQVVVALKCS